MKMLLKVSDFMEPSEEAGNSLGLAGPVCCCY